MYQNQNRNNQASALHDITLLMAAGFFILFMVALWYVNPIAKLGKIDNKAEFIINMEWPGDLDSDIDIWVMDPNGTFVWFSNKTPNKSPVSLERDDLGDSNDTIMVNDVPVILKRNLETVTIRSILPGEYIVNIHYYSRRSMATEIPVTIKVEKLNPTVKIVFMTNDPIVLRKPKDEIMVVRFTIDSDGSVSKVTTAPAVSLIELNAEGVSSRGSTGPRGSGRGLP